MGRSRRPAPEPLETDDVRVLLAGIALWAVALVVLLIRQGGVGDGSTGRWVWVAVAGVFLGLVALRHVRRRQITISEQHLPPGAAADAAPKEPFT